MALDKLLRRFCRLPTRDATALIDATPFIPRETQHVKIVITGTATACDRETEKMLSDSQRLSQLDGLKYSEESCGEYLSETLYDIGVIGGHIELVYRSAESQLHIVTTYHAPRKLSRGEIQLLTDETTGQWSDGIGEGEFQHAEKLGIDIDIAGFDSEPTVEQVDDGIVVRKPKRSELVQLLENRRVDEDAAVALVKSGVAIDVKNRNGQTVLELACGAVLPNLVELLLQRGAMEHAVTPNRTLSKLAFCSGPSQVLEDSVRIAQGLVESGVDVDTFDEYGRTPLMMAANRNNLPLVKFLLSSGANINGQDADALNRLSVLMYAQHLEMLQYLLESGADPNICTANGENAYEYQLRCSHQKNYKEMAETIERHLT